MLKVKPDFQRPPRIPLGLRKERLRRDAPAAMADYLKSQQSLLDRMVTLRAARLKQQSGES